MTTVLALAAVAVLFGRWAGAGDIARQWWTRRQRARRLAPARAVFPPTMVALPPHPAFEAKCGAVGRYGEHCELADGHEGNHRGEGSEWP